jgi:hypothetical protein
MTVAVARDRFQRFMRHLHGKMPVGEEGAAALPCTIAETVRALDPKALQHLARSTLSTAPFLTALEESQLPDTSLRYVLVHDEIGPAGFLLMTLLQLDLSGVVGGAVDRTDSRRGRVLETAGRLLKRASREGHPARARIMVGGHPLFWGNHFLSVRDPEPSPSLLATLVRAGYRIRKLEGIKVSLLKDFPTEDLPLLTPPLKRYGYVRFETQPNMVLRIDPRWKTFGGYLQALSGKYRKTVKERRRVFESSGLTLERARPTSHAPELAELYANIWHRAATRLVKVTPSFFRAVEDHLRDAFRLWVVKKNQHLIGFITAIHDRLPQRGRNRLLGLFLGLDYSQSEEHRLYWNLLYTLVEEAINEGFDTLDLGRTALQAKAELGAQPEPLHCFIRHRNPPANALMRVLFEQVIEPAQAPERHALR